MSRFVVLEVPDYTFEEFTAISISRLEKEGVPEYIAASIAKKVWFELGSRDFRDVIKIGRLSKDGQQVSYIIDIIKKHRKLTKSPKF